MTGEAGAKKGAKQKSRLKMTNAENDARYVALGRTLVLKDDPDREEILKKANKKKNGHPYVYPESQFLALATIRSFCGLSFRMLEGMAIESLGADLAPGYRQIHRRVNAIKVSIKDNIMTATSRAGTPNMAIDGTGLSPNARSEYIRFKHKVKHGFIKMVLVVDSEAREILAFSVTTEETGEAPQFEPLVKEALENVGIDLPEIPEDTEAEEEEAEELQDEPQPATTDYKILDQIREIVMRADGGFDSREIFQFCKRIGLIAYIRMRYSATALSKNCSATVEP